MYKLMFLKEIIQSWAIYQRKTKSKQYKSVQYFKSIIPPLSHLVYFQLSVEYTDSFSGYVG